ncbi:MAG: hypothetical protein R2851_11560 [Caldilineaceae bacterium]
MDAWVWSEGTLNQDADRQPPALTFADICPAPTATPTATAFTQCDRHGHVHAQRHVHAVRHAHGDAHTAAYATPLPTVTPTPLPGVPVIVTFAAGPDHGRPRRTGAVDVASPRPPT